MKRILLILGGLFLVDQLFSKSNNTPSTDIDNLDAFLKTIQFAEGTFYQPNPYAVTYAYDHMIQNFSDHPAITGEWLGKTLPNSFCLNVGLPVGCKSTAAGAYQIIKPTWQNIKNVFPILQFDNYGQDEAVVYLIKQKSAYQDILNGNLEYAISKCNTIWASLPGSPYGQPTKSMDQLIDFYLSKGGTLIS
ncbi:MAG: glycoside hydrolase family 104 protein [Chitinophagales bacterium]|nr:glycoside hydrolase family 104 protein [Chitinophagales bacterium]